MSVIIALTGLMGSGKNTLASAAVNKLPNFRELAFADPLKEEIKYLFNLSSNQEYEDFKHTQVGKVNGRFLVREIGMLMRSYDTEQFVNHLYNRIKEQNSHTVITDLRFRNEYQLLMRLRQQGYKVLIVKVEREEDSLLPKDYLDHVSERGFLYTEIDKVIYNINKEQAITEFLEYCREEVSN